MARRTARRSSSLLGRRVSPTTHIMADPIHGRALVAFDFDGTMTIRDSFTAFLAWRAGSVRYAIGCARLAPAAVAYLFHRNRGKLKAAAVREFLKGARQDDLEAEAREFARLFAPRLLRPDALATWRRWRSKGAETIIVTASPDLVVAPFARGLGADGLIGSALDFENDRATGDLLGDNCRGPEKVRRLQERYGDDIRLAAAYGDTSGDKEMLAIADDPGYRVFTARP